MLTNAKVTIKELQRVSEGSTIRDWVEIGEEDIFIVPAGSELKKIAEAYQIFGEPCEAFGSVSSQIEEGHRLVYKNSEYDVKGVKIYFGSGSVDNKHFILEKRKK